MEATSAWSLCLSGVVVLLSIGPLTFGRVEAGYSAQHMGEPRALFIIYSTLVKRAVWCHQNCWEIITFLAPACLLSLLLLLV